MKFEIFDDSKNYTAQVIKLPPKEKVQGLDNLVKVEVFGNSCLISKDANESDLYLFFPAGTRLSEMFLKRNNLYRESQLNADPNEKGFFEVNGRVKAIKFKGIISSGFVTSIGSLPDELHISKGIGTCLAPGDEFNAIDGVEICRKYFVTPSSTPSAKGDRQTKINNRLLDLMIPNQFRFHVDTAHLAKNFEKLNLNDIITITDKWHGSSCILSRVLIAKKLNLWQKFVNFLGGKIPDREYGYIYSSGKPKSNLPKGIEGEWINDGKDFYLNSIWKDAFDDYKYALEDGITLYGELVGYTKGGQAIQKDYDYGCVPNERLVTEHGKVAKNLYYRFVVYRITYTKPDGSVIEFTWNQIINYCRKYKIETVKEIFHGSVFQYLNSHYLHSHERDTTIGSGNEMLLDSITHWVEHIGHCPYCTSKVPNEGVVVRIDSSTTYEAYKLKSKSFLKKESDDLDQNIVSIEDQA